MFDRAINHDTLVSIGVRLSPQREQSLLDELYNTSQARVRRVVESRLGFKLTDDSATRALLQAYFLDYKGILHTVCMTLFREVESGKWRAA